VRLQASPQLSVLGIPLQGRILLSTEAERFRYDLNTISFNLDQTQLLEQMRSQAADQLSGKTGVDLSQDGKTLLKNRLAALRQEAYRRALKKLGPHQDLLADSSLLDQLEELKQMERIEQVLASPRYESIQALAVKSYRATWESLGPIPNQSLYGFGAAERLSILSAGSNG
jgi:hypothetical protein